MTGPDFPQVAWGQSNEYIRGSVAIETIVLMLETSGLTVVNLFMVAKLLYNFVGKTKH